MKVNKGSISNDTRFELLHRATHHDSDLVEALLVKKTHRQPHVTTCDHHPEFWKGDITEMCMSEHSAFIEYMCDLTSICVKEKRDVLSVVNKQLVLYDATDIVKQDMINTMSCLLKCHTYKIEYLKEWREDDDTHYQFETKGVYTE
jgi:hypothetical protein